jgi:hypothetical protein
MPPLGPSTVAVITQLANVLIRGIEQDRKVRETDEMEERIAELERGAEAGGKEVAT